MELQTIQNKIYEIRGQQVMLDFDLAPLYQVQTKVLKQAVRRNIERFPADFMFEITIDEYNSLKDSLRSQIVTSSFCILLLLIGNENVLGIYLNFFLLLDSTLSFQHYKDKLNPYLSLLAYL